MTFGERLTALRKERGYKSRRELGEATGVPETTLRHYEAGDREPGHTFIRQMAAFFGVSADYMLGLTDDRTPQIGPEADWLLSRYAMLNGRQKQLVHALIEAMIEKSDEVKS